MTVVKRSVMTLFSGGLDPRSHKVRIVLAEKGVTVDILNVDPKDTPQELIDINPYGTIPTLIDRDLVLYDANIIMEYLDERFPHPPLLPVYPVARAKCRMMIFRIDRDWYSLVDRILLAPNKEEAAEARKDLRGSLLSLAPIFSDTLYFLNDEFSLVDCCVAPLLWRLPLLGIELPAQIAKPIKEYCQRVFSRESFQASLTEPERELSEHHDI
jgi:RNA polymerase-associated protein